MKQSRSFLQKTKLPILVLILCGLLLTCTGCASYQKEEGSISVVSTIFAPYDFTRVLTENTDIAVNMLLKPGSESHSFEPTPSDMITIQNADLFLYVGGESDEWVSTILEGIDQSQMETLTLMDCVALKEEVITDGMTVHGDEDEDEAEYDEHVWTSPKNAMLIVQKISAALQQLSPENAAQIAANESAYQSKLAALDADFTELVENAARTEIIMGDRFPFLYFADAYGLSYDAAFPGCVSENEPSAKTLTHLIDKVKEEQIPVVFHIELSNEAITDAICEATGAKKLLLHACHNISKDDFEAGESYLSLMRQNYQNLKEALY